MFGSYKSEDVTILLKDITGQVQPQSTEEREKLIQGGRHYCEMLPIEYEPSEQYMKSFFAALDMYSGITAEAVGRLGQLIYKDKGEKAVLVSLARAGTSVGVLLKHYMDRKYGINVAHYTISIIRGRGIDKNAMDYILSRHEPEDIQFIDGWTGKGAITRQLEEAMLDYPQVSAGLGVLSDPAYISEKCGTHDDFLIASSCLNSTVSGLLSRTFLRSDIIGEKDFHGAVFYKELANKDLTYKFIDTVEEHFDFGDYAFAENTALTSADSMAEVKAICADFGISDINLVKPSIGEATRVLLRRLPWKMLVHSLDDHEHLGHLYQLAEEKGCELIEYPLKHYRACGLIKQMADN
ncbi:cysteine protease StiP family protein [uncultured Ruminococcus sp.]|uniref:cysteine protease StiP family protein n=1 Tax=uncultured Ruminococcus sp. TaxID=165186 RepID=UPI0025F9905F|nr:cysteine protease StiP family protein [uncultured Ruminococcus sp.]